MWQEIIVGLVIAAAALFMGIRFWKSMTAARRGDVCDSCGCSSCTGASASGEPCHPERQ